MANEIIDLVDYRHTVGQQRFVTRAAAEIHTHRLRKFLDPGLVLGTQALQITDALGIVRCLALMRGAQARKLRVHVGLICWGIHTTSVSLHRRVCWMRRGAVLPSRIAPTTLPM